MRVRVVLSLVSLFLSWYCEIGEAQLTVEVRRYNQSSSSLFSVLLEGDQYSVVSTFTDPQGFSNPLAWFMTPYTNIPSEGISGILHYPNLDDACSEDFTVDPPPTLLDVINATWFAIVDNYPACILEKISALRNAGYQLIITYSHRNRYRHVDMYRGEDVATTEFPIAIVTEEYVDYLVTTLNATSDSLLVVFVSADPTAQVWIQVAIVTFITVFLLLLPVTVCVCVAVCIHFNIKHGDCAACTFIAKCCIYKCRKRTGRYEIHEVQHRELGEGGENANEGGRESYEMTSLPQRERVVQQFDLEVETNTACPICLDDFNAGDLVEVLPCDSHHIFHPACIEQWLSAQCVCPVCRNIIR